MDAARIDWSAVEIEPPEAPGWLGTVTGIWMVCGFFGVGASLMICLLPTLLMTSVPLFAIGLFTMSAALRFYVRRIGQVTTSGITAVVFGLLMLTVPIVMIKEGIDRKWEPVWIITANVFAIPALAMLCSGWWVLVRRGEYQNWIDARKRCRFVSHAAEEVIRSEAAEREIPLPEGELHALNVDSGSIFANHPQPLNWIALARTGPDGIRTAWQLPAIVGHHDEYPPERLRRMMIFTFANGIDPIAFDGESLNILRFHVSDRRFEVIAKSMFDWLKGLLQTR